MLPRPPLFKKVLVANRGEIAVRVIRALRQMGIPSVAVYSSADRAALHVRMADEAFAIGPAPSSESYLKIDTILATAQFCGADAIHPGYGFLSENAEFAAACEQAGICFIGPPSTAIAALGRKTDARQLVAQAGVPMVPGTAEAVADAGQARRIAASIGYPVMLKAAAGGGGKGMRRVDTEAQLAAALRDASAEAAASFKDPAVYIEKLIERPRHIEVQVLGDQHGTLLYLGERECSLQRRHQKVIEECPSPLVAAHPEMRRAMGEAAVKAARAAGYYNAGTVEFLVDEQRNFYFLEMNTRLQVEHPVTEMVTGLDLVEWQLRIAAGHRLTLRQDEVAWRGWAVECRVYAEDPEQNFFPSPGTITRWAAPAGPGVRLDSGAYCGWNVPTEYDPMLAKLAAWGESRDQAIRRLHTAIGEFEIAGIRTNLSFFEQVLADEEFQAGRIHTGFIPEYLARRGAAAQLVPEDFAEIAGAVAASERKQRASASSSPQPASGWVTEGRAEQMR
jgi:acetyl-CoA carboxylase, biotin carboxylase subunit